MSTACGEKRGEYAGYMRHARAGESACNDCLRAAAAYQKQRQKTPPQKRRHAEAAAARQSALIELSHRYPDEYRALYAAALAKAHGVRLT